MLHLPLLVCLAGAPDLGSWDFEPWENLVPTNDPVVSPLVAAHRIRLVGTRRDATGQVGYIDTAFYWTDARGVCRSDRYWTYHDTTSLESMAWYGMHPGSSNLPPDSGRSERWVDGRLREVGALHRETTGPRTIWRYALDPAPEGFRTDWDSSILERDGKGRITSVHDVWTGFAWESDSIAWAADGSPSRWTTSTGEGWGDLVETHEPTWKAGRLVRDEVLSIRRNMGPIPDSTTWTIACTWIDDSLLRGCTSSVRASNTSTSTSRRTFDSLAVVRDGSGRARRLELFKAGRFDQLTLWDDQGRTLSRRDLYGETLPALSVDSSEYGELPWPVRLEHRYGDAATLFDTPELQDVATLDWQLDPVDLAVSPRARSASIAVSRAGSHLRAEAPAGTTGTFRLLDPAGRERSRAPLRNGRATLEAPGHGGVWIWRLEDREGGEIGRGRIAIP